MIRPSLVCFVRCKAHADAEVDGPAAELGQVERLGDHSSATQRGAAVGAALRDTHARQPVLSPDGEEISFVDAERSGAASLGKWDLDIGVF